VSPKGDMNVHRIQKDRTIEYYNLVAATCQNEPSNAITIVAPLEAGLASVCKRAVMFMRFAQNQDACASAAS